jgi:hypothetical protein
VKVEKEKEKERSKGSDRERHERDKDKEKSSERKGHREKESRDVERKKEWKRKGDESEEKQESKKIKLESSSSSPAKKNADPLKPKLLPRLNVEIDSTSGINFSDVLGCLDSKKLSKSGSSKKQEKEKESKRDKKKTASASSSVILPPPAAPPAPKVRTAHEKIITPTTLISPHYKPSTSSGFFNAKSATTSRAVAKVPPFNHTKPEVNRIQQALADSLNDKYWAEDSRVSLPSTSYEAEGEALSKMITSRNQR